MITLCGFAVSNYYNIVKHALLEKGIAFTEEHVLTRSKDEAVLSASPLKITQFSLNIKKKSPENKMFPRISKKRALPKNYKNRLYKSRWKIIK